MMNESYNFGDINLQEEIVVEYIRECDEDGCRVMVNRITLFIENHAVKMPNGLYNMLYRIFDEHAAEMDPFDHE